MNRPRCAGTSPEAAPAAAVRPSPFGTTRARTARSPDSLPFRFTCRRSGNCCSRPGGVVQITGADVARAAAQLGFSERAFRSRYVAACGDHLIDGPGTRCPFLEDGRTTACRIYTARPERCRTWPFWDELRRSPRALREAARLCPGIELLP